MCSSCPGDQSHSWKILGVLLMTLTVRVSLVAMTSLPIIKILNLMITSYIIDIFIQIITVKVNFGMHFVLFIVLF